MSRERYEHSFGLSSENIQYKQDERTLRNQGTNWITWKIVVVKPVCLCVLNFEIHEDSICRMTYAMHLFHRFQLLMQ